MKAPAILGRAGAAPTRRRGQDRVAEIERKRPRSVLPVQIVVAGVADPTSEILSMLDGLLAEGRALVQSRETA